MSTTDSPPPPPPTPPPSGPTGPRVTGQEARDLSTLRRTTKASPEGRHLAGVAGGLGRHFDIDPVIVRVLLVVLVFFGGAGLLLYGAGWLLVPEEGSDRATVHLDDRNRPLALYGAAALAALAVLGDTVGRFDFPWPLAIIALILLVVFGTRDRVKAPDRAPSHGAGWVGGTGPMGPTDPTVERVPETASYGQPPAAPGAGSSAFAAAPSAYSVPVPAQGWVGDPGGPWSSPRTYVPQPNPRRRGPILFWFTLALIAFGLGLLGIVDAAGADIPDSAYPALAVGVTGLMLVLGAFWGRAGGLILVGLLATIGLVGSTAHHEFGDHGHRVHAAPTSAAAVHDEYDINAGELVLDLTRLSDPQALDGRTIRLEGGIGKISVVVPDDWTAHAEANVGVGSVRVLADGERGGFGVSQSSSDTGEPGTPEVRFDVNLGVGAIQVMRSSDFPWPDHHFSGWSLR